MSTHLTSMTHLIFQCKDLLKDSQQEEQRTISNSVVSDIHLLIGVVELMQFFLL